MFYCQFCGTLVSRGIRSKLIPILFKTQFSAPNWRTVEDSKETRLRHEWRKLPREKTLRRCKDGRKRRMKLIEICVPGKPMRQIAQERRACPACARQKSAAASQAKT
jgi:hypothetical protein